MKHSKKDLKKYLAKELSSKEQHQFERKMEQHPFLKEATEGLEEWLSTSNKTTEQLEVELSKIEDSINRSTNSRIKQVITMPLFKIMAIAATLIACIFFTTKFLYENRMYTIDLYTQNFKPLTHPDGMVRSDIVTNKDEIEQKAVYYYEQENYKKAVYYYEKVIEKTPTDEKNNLFLSISYLANYQTDVAIKLLTNTSINWQQYIYDRDWYLALAYLKSNNLTAAQPLLQELAKQENFYQQNAIEIITAIE